MADERPVGVAVVGTGFGVLTHLRALRAAGFEVEALVGRDAAKAAERARRFDVPYATDDLSSALGAARCGCGDGRHAAAHPRPDRARRDRRRQARDVREALRA